MRENDDLDLLLDSALSTYADPGPEAGLEGRVLNALSAFRVPGAHTVPVVRRPRRVWLALAFALPVSAYLPLLWLAPAKTTHAPSIPVQPAQRANQSPVIPRTAVPEVSMNTSHRRVARPALTAEESSTLQAANPTPLPKLDVFPTPQPLSAQERTLALVAKQTPLPLRKALLEAQQDDAPIHIAATHIPPLESPEQGQP